MDDHNKIESIYVAAGQSMLANLPLSMVLTDPNRPDNPIIYVNRAFEQLTGYAASAVVGRNCRFLQGDDRDQPEVEVLRRAIEARESVTVTLDNVRLDGSSFRNRLIIAPAFDEDGSIYAFIGIQAEVEDVDAATKPDGSDIVSFDDRLQEMQHRVKNHLQMVASMIRLQSRDTDPRAAFPILARRVDALAALYDEFHIAPRRGEMRYDVVSAGGYVSRVVSIVGALDGRRNVRVTVDTDSVYMRTERAAQLGLLTSELLSNAFNHAFEGRSEGVVSVQLKELGGDRLRLTVSDDGIGMDEGTWPENGNLGARIARGLVGDLGAEMTVMSTGSGTIVTVQLDNPIDTSLEADGRRILSDADGQRTGEIERLGD
ncbi:PAS domain-containing protein [uncultured Jannaschia sp.]|uniref:PAS domain-containing protein n=1 Tax=uncultured Jannaschia sp. TaxID=293347 RepID=UPI0026343024|nr:PAS domain-containing protein [uncultured Jannaschia sp.]